MEEQKYIDMFPFEQLYNISPKAISSLWRKHTIETKTKISESLKINNHNNIKIYSYNENLELIPDKPFTSIKEVYEYFGVTRSTIDNKLKKAVLNPYTLQNINGKLVLLFNTPISPLIKPSDLIIEENFKNIPKEVWVYTKNEDGKLIVYSANPWFNSAYKAGKTLKIDTKSVLYRMEKGSYQNPLILTLNEVLVELYFYDNPQN